MERGNLASDGKGNDKRADPVRKNTDAEDRGGATRSSDEVAVIVMERRGCVIRLLACANQSNGRSA